MKTTYYWQTLDIQNVQTFSSNQAISIIETNILALKNEIQKANKDNATVQKRANDAKFRLAVIALANTKWFNKTLTTIKTTLDNFILILHRNIDFKFDKPTIQKIAALGAKTINISESDCNLDIARIRKLLEKGLDIYKID
jgi:DNA-binding GntR family transcriptional regulator